MVLKLKNCAMKSQTSGLELISSDEGVFCCFETLACEDNCPLGLSLDFQMEYVQRKLGFII
jgi:succinate dehydrogenase/fumarate reductase-like Fe-S protein